LENTPSAVELTGPDFLDQLAEDTWIYLSSNWATTNHLPWSWRSETISGGDYANTAEIGLLALSWLAAYDMQTSWSPTWGETEAEISFILNQLRAWQTGSQESQPHGANAYNNSVFYQWYWISWNPPVVGNDSGFNRLVPSIDNAWLAASLITIREYAETHKSVTLTKKADEILSDLDFTLWYDENSHQFYWGAVENPQGGTLADYYSNENRIVNFVARSLGHVSKEDFLLSLNALEQYPASYDGITVEKVAWDGSYFTYVTPALFIQEIDTPYGTNTILSATQAQIAYAQDQGYEAWGLSDCFDTGSGGYIQQGSPPTGMFGTPEIEPGLVTAHASALALNTPLAPEAITNLQIILETFPCAYHSDYGFNDSVVTKPSSPEYGQCSERFSALAQEWIFLSIANYKTGFVRKYFYQDSGVQRAHLEMFGQTSSDDMNFNN